MVTVHTNSVAQIWAWDWCKTGPGTNVGANLDMDDEFFDKYGTGSSYSVRIQLTDEETNTWTSYLCNYAEGTWDTFFTSHGEDQTNHDYGWDMFEYYSDETASGDVGVCDDLANRRVTSSGIQLQTSDGGAWSAAGTRTSSVFPAATMDPDSYLCSGVSGRMITPNSHWQVTVS